MSKSGNRPVLSPNNVGLFVGFEQCPRYMQQSLGVVSGNQDELGVFLSGIGDRFEDETFEQLRTDATEIIDAKEEWNIDKDPQSGSQALTERLRDALESASATAPVLINQPPARGQIGVWGISGRGDLLALWKASNGIIAQIFEVKASQDVQPYHQIQAGIYALLCQDILNEIVDTVDTRISIVHRDTEDIDLTTPSTIPTIEEPDVVKNDIQRLLREGGTIDRIYNSDDVKYTLTGKCNTCLYNEECFKHALDNRHLALLGLTEGEQRILEKYDITTIEDLANLKENIDEPKPYVFEELPPRDDDKVKKLLNEPSIGTRIDKMVQRAQAILAGVQTDEGAKNDPQARTGPFYDTPLQGSGESTLPSTNPTPNQESSMNYDPDDMIRVYLYVREDFTRDTLALLAGRVVRNNAVASPLKFSSVADRLPDNDQRDEVLDVEGELLSDFFMELFRAIDLIAEGRDQEIVHTYFFSRMERDALVDAILRQMPRYEKDSFNAIRDILGYRKAIDQPMVSIVQDELQDRFALRYPGSGILPVLEQAKSGYCDCGCDGIFKKSDWMTTRKDGYSFNCSDSFKHNFFTFKLPVETGPDGTFRSEDDIDDAEHFYPLRARFDNQIPLEYIWAARRKLDLDWADSGRQRWEILNYQYHDADSRNEPITAEDVGLLGEKLCHALQHIESCIGKHQNPFIGKEEINIPDLPTFNLGDIDLARALSDYLDLEHYADRQEKYREYALSPRERVQTGYAAILEVTSTELKDDDLVVKGDLLYKEDEFNNPEQVAYSCRLKGTEMESGGSHRVANPVTWKPTQKIHKDIKNTPADIESGLPVEVEHIDTGNRRIRILCGDFNTKDNFRPNTSPDRYEYIHRHDVWTNDPQQAGPHYGVRQVYIEPGDRYILDRQTDNWTSTHAHEVLSELQENRPSTNPRYHYYHSLNQLIGGDRS